MKSIFLTGCFLCTVFFNSKAQTVHLQSFQHVVRWVSETNFAPFITHTNIQDSVLQHVAVELKAHFKTDSVSLPGKIDYKDITMFGKPSLKDPAGNNSGNYEVTILSFITRATVGFAVDWKMKIAATQNGNTVYSKETSHEIEYFTSSGYLTNIEWFTDESFIDMYTAMLKELLETGAALPEKIIIGSTEAKAKEAQQLLGDTVGLMLKTNGNMLNGGNFILSLQKEKDTLTTVTFKEGWDQSWPKLDVSGAAASLFHQVTGINIGYNSKSKEKRFGRLDYTNGREIRLRMEWIESTEKSTDGSTGLSQAVSPMVLEAFEEKNMIGYFTFCRGCGQSGYSLAGKIGEDSVAAVYNPSTSLITIAANAKTKVVVVLNNLNPDSRTFSNNKISKNKVWVSSSSGSPGKARFTNPEWYAFYATPNLPAEELNRYVDAVLCLFFGMGNQF